MSTTTTAYKFNPHQDPGQGESLGKLPGVDEQTAPWQSRRVWYPGPNEALKAPAVLKTESLKSVQGPHTGQLALALPVEPVKVPSRTYVVEERFQILQKWEGEVLTILRDTFIGRLVDLTDPKGLGEEAEFFQSDIAPSDQHLLEVGAIFYWSISYRNTLDGQRQRLSELRFRRLPAWTRKEIAAAKQDVQRLKALLAKRSRPTT